MKKVEETETFAKNVAERQGWALVWDTSFTTGIIEGLTSNFNKLGYYQCPCREAWGNRKQDRDVTCPCRYSHDDISEFGHCFCGLFASPEFNSREEALNQIPERRPEDLIP